MKRIILLCTVIAAAMMELIDTSIVNVSISHMSGNLGATFEDTSWVITSYAISNVIIIPLTSFLTAKLGRRNYYIGSIIAFTAFSYLCGAATNIWVLVAFRFLQGIGGGALISVSLPIVFELFPPEKRSIASALFGLGVFVGPTLGPTLGGFVIEYYSWPWIFYINVPMGILTAISCYFLLGEPKQKQSVSKIDWTGISLLAVGIGALQIVLERGQTENWFETNYIILLSIVAALGLFLFIWWELKVKEPIVNLRIFKSRNLSIAATLTFISGVGLYSSIFLSPLFAQSILNFPPLATGLLLLPGSCLAILGLMISGRLLSRGFSPFYLIVSGMIMFIIFSWQMSHLNGQSGSLDISLALIWRALGLAILTVPLTTLAVTGLSLKQIPQASSLNNMMRQLGGSFGIALVNTYLFRRTAVHRTDLISNLSTDNFLLTDKLNGYTHYLSAKGFSTFESSQKGLALLDNAVSRQSNILGYTDSYLLVGILFLIGLPLLFLAQRKRSKTPPVIVSDH